MLNITYVVMHAGCTATPRQRQTIEHFRHARRYKFGTLLEYPVEIFARNQTLALSTATLLGGLHVRSSATASLLCLVLTSSFACLRSPFPVSVSSVSFVPSRLRDNSYSDEISPEQVFSNKRQQPEVLLPQMPDVHHVPCVSPTSCIFA